MSAIFLSHSSRDASVAAEVRERLREQGHRSVFLDFDPECGIPAGRDWEQELYRQLRVCQAVIVLCSEHTMASHWCFAEITHAKALGKQVFPVKVAPCEIEPILTSRQVLDLTRDREETYRRLWHGLRAAGLDPADAFDWDGSRPPYPGLLAFQEEDAAVFFGREREIHEGLQQLRRLQRFGAARMLLVLGASGSGKSSLVRAGLLPRLRRSAESWIVLDPFRPGDDPFRELAGALSHALREAGKACSWQRLHERLRSAEGGARAAAGPPVPGATSGSSPAGAPAAADRGVAAALDALEAALRGRPDPEAARHLQMLRGLLAQGAEEPGTEAAASAATAPGAGGELLALATDLRLGGRRPEAQLLVTVDQLEELLGQPDDHPASGFLRLLRAALDAPGSPIVLLATMRSDYLGTFQKAPALLGLRFENLSVGPMAPESVGQIVENPARAAGIDLEPGLTEALVEDARGEEALPLLAFTLRELWERHADDGLLTVSEYRVSLGGLTGSVARAADGVLGDGELPGGLEADLRRAFLQMVRITEGGGFARQPARWRDLPPAVHGLLERFVRARLLVSRDEGGERMVEVAHEAIFRSWERLRRWLDEGREFLLWRRRLRTAHAQWRETGLDDGALLRGVALAEAERWLGEHPEGLEEERPFIEESAAHQSRQLAAARRRRRRALATAIGAAAVFLTLAALAWTEYLVARRNALEQKAGLIVKTATTLRDPLLGAQLLLESAELLGGDEPAGGADAARINAGRPLARSVLYGHGEPLNAVAFSPDDRWILTASQDDTARVWRSDGTGKPVVLEGHEGEVTAAAFSPDGTRVVTASLDGTARVWRADGSGQPVVLGGGGGELLAAAFSHDGARVVTASSLGTAWIWNADGSGAGIPLRGHGGPVRAAGFSPGDTWIATGSDDGTARLWRADGAGPPVVLEGHSGGVGSVHFSPDGGRLVTASPDRTARVWSVGEPAEPVVLTGHDGRVWKAVFSHDGEIVATASDDGTARLWRTDGTGEPVVLEGHDDWVRDVAFSPDDETLLTASHDGEARLWRVGGGTLAAKLVGHEGWVRVAAFSQDGAWIATGSDDDTVRVWDARFVPDPPRFEGHRHHVWDANLSHDGSRLVSASADRTARVWDAAGAGRPIVFSGHTERLRSASFSPDDTRILTSSDDGTARIWNADGTGEPIVLEGHGDKVLDARWSHDGRRVVTASYDRTVRIWSTEGRQLRVLTGHRSWVRSAVFSRDDTRVLTASADRTLGIWAADGSGEPVFLSGHTDQVMTAAWSADESRIVSASADRTARVWDADGSGEPLVLAGHEGLVWSAAFSPDGTKVVTASADWTARVWNADGTGAPVFLEGHQGPVWSAAFGPDGTHIVTASADRVVRLWRLWPLGWPELLEDLRRRTNACITVPHRTRYLQETTERARDRYEECERSYDRR